VSEADVNFEITLEERRESQWIVVIKYEAELIEKKGSHSVAEIKMNVVNTEAMTAIQTPTIAPTSKIHLSVNGHVDSAKLFSYPLE
jgi:hypothetical protein